MTFEYVRHAVVEDVNSFYFTYQGKACGVEIYGNLDNFDIYCDDESKIVHGDFDVAVREPMPFFDGKSVLELFDLIADTICFA